MRSPGLYLILVGLVMMSWMMTIITLDQINHYLIGLDPAERAFFVVMLALALTVPGTILYYLGGSE